MTVEKYMKQQTENGRVLTATQAYLELCALPTRPIKNDVPFAVTVGGGPLPEHMEIEFCTSGFEGGNGSTHELVFSWGGGVFEPEIAANGLRLKVQGDWELEGMLDALIALGEHLRLYRRNVGRSLLKNPVDP